MEIAFSATTPGATVPQLVDLCRRAEELGYRQAWLAEVAGPEAFATAGAIAAATNLDVGVAVVAASTRSPALLAMGAGSVSQLLGDRRFFLGIGTSSELIVEQWHGRTFERPLRVVREAVEATRTALTGGTDYDGEMRPMHRFRLASPPSGPVNLYVGALNPGMLRLAGRVGDGVCLNMMAPEVVVRQRAEIAAGAARRDDPPAPGELPDGFGVMARLHVVPTDDLAAGREMVRRAFAPYFAQSVYNRFLAWCGYPDEAAAIAAGFAAGDRAAVARAMHDEVVDAVAIVGDVDRISGRLDEYAAAGLDVGAVGIIGDLATVDATLTGLAERGLRR